MKQKKRKQLTAVFLAVTCLAAVLFAGCSVHVNVKKEAKSLEEMLEARVLTADPAEVLPDGKYQVTVHCEEGGLEKMDLSQAYVEYETGEQDLMETLESLNEDDEIPPLPADVQEAMPQDAEKTRRVAVIAVAAVDDNTLQVRFTDPTIPAGAACYFVIPNEEIACSWTM